MTDLKTQLQVQTIRINELEVMVKTIEERLTLYQRIVLKHMESELRATSEGDKT